MRSLFLLLSFLPGLATSATPADSVYRNGIVATMDAQNTVLQAVAVSNGRISYAGSNEGAQQHIGPGTRVVDLEGRLLMPGLVDAHMHPQSGGARLLNCNLNYEKLTVPQFQSRIQACLDKDRNAKSWLVVVNWFQQGMQPGGVAVSHATLDALRSQRPIIVRSSFGHSVLLNTRGLQLAGVKDDTPDPHGGKIARDARGKATGLLEDAAQDMAMKLLPPLTVAGNLAASSRALDAMRKQGITTFLDAYTDPETLTAFATLQRQRKLTARAHFAVLVEPEQAPDQAVNEIRKLASQFDQGATRTEPSMQVRHAKLFMDGVIAAPALTGAMLTPYFTEKGEPGTSAGPAPYFAPAVLQAMLRALAQAHIDPHLHVDGDRAVREALDAIEAVRATPEGAAMRPALAHNEIVDPQDFDRFAQLDATAVLSFQWAKPAPDTVEALQPYMGPIRYGFVEPQFMLRTAGARIAFGSDWPVDPLNEWFALQVAVTRAAGPDAEPQYQGRLGTQPGLPRAAALRAMTIEAAYVLRQEQDIGSLEKGKLADMIVLDRNVFDIPPEEIARTRVLQTIVGGKTVYEAK